jgi:DNA ligase-1
MTPMLLCRDTPDTSKLRYPVYAFPKLDGIRCVVVNGVPKTRTLKDIPNKYIREALSRPEYEGFDGELIVGDACSPSVYRDTNSVVMSHNKTDYFYYFVFDLWNDSSNFLTRYNRLVHKEAILPENVIVLHGQSCSNEQQLLDYEQQCLHMGYEGLIIRDMFSPYKFGRTTMKENNTYKLKKFVDSEAIVVGMVEEMENTNEKTTNELGRSSRSTAQSGLIGKKTMGALLVRDVVSKVEFQVGSGFTAEERQWFWDKCNVNLPEPVIIKYKSFMIGVKDKPRHPIYLGLRSKLDM